MKAEFRFKRRVRHYPRGWLPPECAPNPPAFVRRVPIRPGRFIVMNPVTKEPAWEIPNAYLSEGNVVAPVNPAFYLARVEDASADGAFIELWEVPGGLSGTTMLTKEQLGGLTVEAGDTLRIYTWMEIPKVEPDGFGEPVARVKVERTPATTRDREGTEA